ELIRGLPVCAVPILKPKGPRRVIHIDCFPILEPDAGLLLRPPCALRAPVENPVIFRKETHRPEDLAESAIRRSKAAKTEGIHLEARSGITEPGVRERSGFRCRDAREPDIRTPGKPLPGWWKPE